jgi:hypothetical protein
VSQTLPSAPVPTGRRRPTPRLPRTRDEVLAATTVVLAVCLAYGSGVFTHDLVDWN